MPTHDDRPKVGDSVWIEERHKIDGRQPNGTIIFIDEEEDVVIVEFDEKDGSEEFPLSMLDDNWTDKFGGMWYVEQL